MSSWRIENAVRGETSSNKTSCLSLTSCLGNPCVPPFIISQCEWALKSLSPSWNRSLPQVVSTTYWWLELSAQSHDRAKNIGWIVKSQCQRGLKIELESQPQNMINLNEVAKDVCLAPDFVRQPSVFSASRSELISCALNRWAKEPAGYAAN